MRKTIADELRRIEQENGILRPRDVVEEARPTTSFLHKSFDWNDTTAAESFRVWQAQSMIRECRVKIEGRKQNVFYNVNVNVDGEQTQGYVSVENVIQDEDMFSQVIADAVREIKYWQKKYNDIASLKGVVNEEKLNEITKELE